MDSLDLNLSAAWNRAIARTSSPLDFRLHPSTGIIARPLRSQSLVIRGGDKRIARVCPPEVVDYHEWPQDTDGPECAIEAVHLTAGSVGQLCAPILIPWPGVPIDAAARTCGVNRTTIHRWAKAGRIVMDIYPKRNGTDLHRADKMVWTRIKLDPGGEVWSPPWGMEMDDAEEISRRLQPDWTQTLHRSHRCLGKKSICMFWQCPKCEKWVYKLYLTLRLWTLPDAMGIPLSNPTWKGGAPLQSNLHFSCRRCAKLLYESTERTSRPAKGRTVDHWDRFIRRLTGGMLRGKEVDKGKVES